ncbi:PP0621 family protein [Aquincola sp. MAHUQ-54]|uniref:PP0621 family protein n=1 Tax=Aquincola agrisoli TaxID=3119538 RepID=A0AAW9Q2N4_9BURK
MKYLVLVLVVVLVLWLMSGRRQRPPMPRPPAPPPRLEGMVSCRHCGLHLPRSEAVADAAGDTYCSGTHRDAGPRG